MEKTAYKGLGNFYLPSHCDWVEGAELHHVKQTYRFGYTGIHNKLIIVDG